MPLTLTYQADTTPPVEDTTLPVEIEGFSPSWAAGKSLAQIGQFEIIHGNQKLPLAEMFNIEGDANDLRLVFQGDLSGVHWIGAHMSEGEIQIHGPCGRHVGSGMTGGTIHIDGDAQDWVGAEMRGGLIHVRGNAGHLVGAAYRGSARGMTDGTILVEGDAGDEIGLKMRRGTIAIGGNAGEMLGFNMLAGTILVFGECGSRPGAGMRRGTLGLLGPKSPALLSSFRRACTTCPQVVPLMLSNLRQQGFSFDEALLRSDYDVYNGDFLELGRGEILVRSRT